MSEEIITLSQISDQKYNLMQEIANDSYTEDSVKKLTNTDRMENQMKLFTLAQAQRELSRVIKLTKFLDKVEDSFENKVNEALDSNNLSLGAYPIVIRTITDCLSRSNIIIEKVMGDETLKNLIFVNNEGNVNSNTIIESGTLNLSNPESRKKVNDVVNMMLMKIDSSLKSGLDSDIESKENNNKNDGDNK